MSDESTSVSDQAEVVSAAAPTPPPYPSAAPTPPPYPGAAAPVPRKRRKGCLVAAGIALLLLLLTCCGGGGLVLALSSKAQEPTVVYSEADFVSAIAKMGLTWPELPEGADPDDYERVYYGQKPMDAVLTEAEISALMSFNHSSSYWPIKSMAVDLTGGNTASVSAVVTYAGRDWPVSAAGSGTAFGSSLDLEVASAEVAGFDVPAEYLPLGADFLENIINPRLARAGISVDLLEVTDDGIHVVGTTWETAEYVPR